MATNIPPHNLNEVSNAVSYLIEKYTQEDGTLNLDDVTVDELMQHIPGPDFPTGGVIVGSEGILQAYSTGRGRVVLRGLAHIEEMSGSRNRVVITEIPYQLNKTTLLERIAELVREGRLDDISDLRDESDRRGMSIIIELRRGAEPGKVLNKLYKYTPLQSTFGVQMLALVEGEPRLLSLKRALQVYIEHRQEVIVRRAKFELEKARARAHILQGLLIALANLDAVIKTIRESADADQAKDRLMTRFKLTEVQAQAILDMQLRRLAALERQKIEDEQKAILTRIADLEDLLAHPRRVLETIQTDLSEIAGKFGDKRRTHIAGEAVETFREEDLVPDEAILIAVTQRGYIRRMAAKSLRTQARGGRGVSGIAPKDEDAVLMLVPARTLDTLLFFSDKGKVYSEKAYQIPDSDRAGKGIALANIISIEQGETITAAVPVPSFDEGRYVTMSTTGGRIKRMSLSEFVSVRPSGLVAIKLDRGDQLGWVRLTSEKDEIILVTEQGKALRYSVASVRPMGRAAGGVTGIRLAKGDLVTSMDVVEKAADLVLMTAGGFGKRTSLNEYPAKGRGTGGVTATDVKALDKIGKVVSARVAKEQDDITIITTSGTVLRLPVKSIKLMGRAARGVRLIELQGETKVSTLARVSAEDLKRAGSGDGTGDGASSGTASGSKRMNGDT
jgi:DNA gyrase subunit A